MQKVLEKLINDFPHIDFTEADSFYWSPKNNTVYYNAATKEKTASWALLHELSHGLLGHKTYHTDFELLQLEVAAWEHAKKLAKDYKITIQEDHVQDCLDTYRDWLHARSKCPACGEHGLQAPKADYVCLNCRASWHVSEARFCRSYRKQIK